MSKPNKSQTVSARIARAAKHSAAMNVNKSGRVKG